MSAKDGLARLRAKAATTDDPARAVDPHEDTPAPPPAPRRPPPVAGVRTTLLLADDEHRTVRREAFEAEVAQQDILRALVRLYMADDALRSRVAEAIPELPTVAPRPRGSRRA